jgi:hypothetical protein
MLEDRNSHFEKYKRKSDIKRQGTVTSNQTKSDKKQGKWSLINNSGFKKTDNLRKDII